MSDFITRLYKSEELLNSPELPVWQRIDPALHVLAGLNLTILNPQVRAILEKSLVEINHIFSRYGIKDENDYQKISQADLDQIVNCLKLLYLRARAFK